MNMTRNCDAFDQLTAQLKTVDPGDVQRRGQRGKEDEKGTMISSFEPQSDSNSVAVADPPEARTLMHVTTEQSSDILTNSKVYDREVGQNLRCMARLTMSVSLFARLRHCGSSHLISLEKALLLRPSAILLGCQRTDSVIKVVIYTQIAEHLCVSPRGMHF
jgi:hypothetical protein